MYYKKANISISLFLILILISSCAHVKNIAYFQKLGNSSKHEKNSDVVYNSQTKPTGLLYKPEMVGPEIKSMAIYHPEINSSGLYEARIKPKDLLSITVVSSEPEASRMYNLIVPQLTDASNQNGLFSQPALQTYLVDVDGNIDFPVFGKIKIIGLTRNEVKTMLQRKLEHAFSKESPIITIRFTNYTVNILGEVNKPGKFESNNDRLTIFEGLALAGDLTIYGRRDNVKVLRENVDGSKEYITVNLMDKDIIYSPAYYLEQNDVVYVEPNKSRSRSSNYGTAESFGITSLSVLLTLTSLVFTVFNLKL